jgi:hypothetical protein
MSGSVLVMTVLPAFKNDKKQVLDNIYVRHVQESACFGCIIF